MSTHLENMVRATLDDLADAPAPANLAEGALRRAARQRRARWAAAGVAAAAAVVVTLPLGVGVLSRSAGDGYQAAAADSAPMTANRRLVVTAYSGISNFADPGPADDFSLLLNPATGRYDKVAYNAAVPSPDGLRVVVQQGDGSPAHPMRGGILDRTTGKVRWINSYDQYTEGGAWSPDGRSILLTHRPKDGPVSMEIVHADTLGSRRVTVPGVDATSSYGRRFLWTPSGKEVAVTVGGGDDREIRYYDLAGKHQRTVPGTTVSLESTGYSPDGRRMALWDDGNRKVQLADAKTGARQGRVSVPGVPLGALVGWYDDKHLVVVRPTIDPLTTAAPYHQQLVVVDLTGKVIRSIPYAEGADHAREVFLGVPAMLSEAAAKLTF
jgi:WD40 repeat protein